MTTNYRLFVDLDGVLADFDAGVVRASGKTPEELDPRRMWPLLAKTPGFYDQLPWMSDGRDLWDFVKAWHPTILTGLPLGRWAEPQKRAWCARELGPEVRVLCCLSREKAQKAAEVLEGGETMILVDDRLKLQAAWEEAGGKFVLHTSARESIETLKALGLS